MRISTTWCACEFVVGGFFLVCSEPRTHALWPWLAQVFLNLKAFPKSSCFGGGRIQLMLTHLQRSLPKYISWKVSFVSSCESWWRFRDIYSKGGPLSRLFHSSAKPVHKQMPRPSTSPEQKHEFHLWHWTKDLDTYPFLKKIKWGMKILRRARAQIKPRVTKLSVLPVTLVLATATIRQLSLWGRRGIRGKKSFIERCCSGWSRRSLFFSPAMGKETSWLREWKGAAPAAEMWWELHGVKTKQASQQPWIDT